MEFFDSLVIPQSAAHIQLLHYMLMLLLCLFIPFISLLFGGTILSLFFRKRGYDTNNDEHIKFSKDIIEISTVSNSVGIILGIAPLLTAILIFIQLLHASNTNIVGYLIAAFFVTAIGIILIYLYRYMLTFNTFFDSFEGYTPEKSELSGEFHKFRVKSIRISNRTGLAGVGLVFIGMWFFVAAFTFAAYPDDWSRTDLFQLLFSFSVLSRFATFILGAFAIAGGALFFNFFAWEGGRKHLPDHYKNFVRKTAITISFTSIVILPIFLMINVLVLPDIALSGTVYSYAIVAILLVFLVLHFIYAMIKYSTTRYSSIVFFVILFIIFSTVITNEMAMSNATHLQSVILSSKFEAYLNTFKGETTGKVAVRSGEEIYETVCSACHRFDKVVVGPAYDNVLPQFEGKKDALVAFIRNPYKVNPKFPPMPNPGLKLEEAQNIADYEIIHHMQDVFPERRKEAGNDGEKIFNRICAACHAFDHPVVGPAFDEVLTKYIGKPDDLIKFVGNPQKINPNYPQMPNPGLDQPQLKAITTYVLSEYRKRK